MTDSTIRRKPLRIDPEGEPIKASGWKNLYFSKEGHSFVGKHVFHSENVARSEAIKSIEKVRMSNQVIKFNDSSALGLTKFRDTRDGHIWFGLPLERFSHHIQVPINP